MKATVYLTAQLAFLADSKLLPDELKAIVALAEWQGVNVKYKIVEPKDILRMSAGRRYSWHITCGMLKEHDIAGYKQFYECFDDYGFWHC